MQYKSKNDYQKFPRSDVHTTIRKDLYKKLKSIALDVDQHSTKCLDIIIEMILKDEKLLSEFKNRVRAY